MNNSPFANLPTELLAAIWTRALTHSRPFAILACRQDTAQPAHLSPPATALQRSSPSLLRTCRVIHHACAPLFYAVNTFVLGLSCAHCRLLCTDVAALFLQQIGRVNAGALRSVVNDLGTHSLDLRSALKNPCQGWFHYCEGLREEWPDCGIRIRFRVEMRCHRRYKYDLEIDLEDLEGSFARLRGRLWKFLLMDAEGHLHRWIYALQDEFELQPAYLQLQQS